MAYALVYLSLTGSIGFVGIPIPNKMGNQVKSSYRAGVVSLPIPSEMETLAIESVQNEYQKDF
jgi:hypothetical protein